MKKFAKKMKHFWPLYIMFLPGAVYLFINCYIPMFGIQIAFRNYKANMGVYGSPWCGLDNFKFLTRTKDAWIMIRNTVLYNLVFIILGTILAVATAIILNDIRSKKGKQLYQTIILIPFLISMVIVSYLAFAFLSTSNGYINNTLVKLFGITAIDWYNNPKYWPVILVLINIWKNLGYNIVLWMAGLTAIPDTLYEAARADGAGNLQCFIYITMPSLLPTLFTTSVLAFLNSFKVFREAYLVAGDYPHESMYMLQHLFNNWFRELSIDKMSAGAVVTALMIMVLILSLQRAWDRED